MKANQSQLNLAQNPSKTKLYSAIASATSVFLLTLFGSSSTAQAEELFSDKGIKFEQDTTIEFEFLESHGAYQSTFGVIDLSTCRKNYDSIDLSTCQKTPLLVETKAADLPDSIYRQSDYQNNAGQDRSRDFLGTPGNAVPVPLVEHTFKAGREYVMYLESSFNGNFAGIVYSTNIYNSASNQQVVFEHFSEYVSYLDKQNHSGDRPKLRLINADNAPTIGNKQAENPFTYLSNGGLLLRWDDTGSVLVRQELQDSDYDDFIVGIGGELDCVFPTSPTENARSTSK